eukprot:12909621-Prorocentrum_lima.AAC.1
MGSRLQEAEEQLESEHQRLGLSHMTSIDGREDEVPRACVPKREVDMQSSGRQWQDWTKRRTLDTWNNVDPGNPTYIERGRGVPVVAADGSNNTAKESTI